MKRKKEGKAMESIIPFPLNSSICNNAPPHCLFSDIDLDSFPLSLSSNIDDSMNEH